MAAEKSRNTRMPSVPDGASKCFRYTQTCSQAAGSQFCQDRGATVCGNVTVAKALSSKPGRSLLADAGPKSQPSLNKIVLAADPLAMLAAPRTAGVRTLSKEHAAVPPSVARRNIRRHTIAG